MLSAQVSMCYHCSQTERLGVALNKEGNAMVRLMISLVATLAFVCSGCQEKVAGKAAADEDTQTQAKLVEQPLTSIPGASDKEEGRGTRKSRKGESCASTSDCERLLRCIKQECVSGAQQAGDECDEESDCRSLICVDGNCTSGKLGDKCKNFLNCREGICLEGKCRPKLKAGQSCASASHCENGTACVDAKCLATKQVGEKCLGPGHCGFEGAACIEGMCVERVGFGKDCVRPAHCQSGLSCIKGKCAPKRDVGEDCFSPKDCETWACYKGKCIERREVGDPCDSPVDCLSVNCESHKCAPRKE